MSLKPLSGAHSMHVLTYHIVWCVKYRHTLLTREIGDRVKEIVSEIAAEIGCEIVEIETDTDHVHVLVRLKPTHQLSKVCTVLREHQHVASFRSSPSLGEGFGADIYGVRHTSQAP